MQQKVFRYLHKAFFDVFTVDRRCLFVRDVIVHLGPFVDRVLRNLPIVSPVTFIAKQKEGKILGIFRARLRYEVRMPLRQVLKALRTHNVIHQNTSLCSSIEGDS